MFKIRQMSVSNRTFSLRSQTLIDYNFLREGIISPESGWIAALIATDGHVRLPHNNIIMRFAYMDGIQLLTEMKTITNCNKQITLAMENKCTVMTQVRFCSKSLMNDFLKLFPCDWKKKSYSLTSSIALFTAANDHCVPGYIRGLSDGDGGWIFQHNEAMIGWSIASNSLDFILGIKELINKHCFGYESGFKIYSYSIHELQLSRRDEVYIFGNWLYEGCAYGKTMCIRKYKQWLVFKECYEREYDKRERQRMMLEYQIQELRNKIQLHLELQSMINKELCPFHLTPDFKSEKKREWRQSLILTLEKQLEKRQCRLEKL